MRSPTSMRTPLRFLPLAAAVLAGVPALATAQQAFGPWIHDAAVDDLILYVAHPPLGSDTNNGKTRSTPFATLQRAVDEADVMLAASSGTVGVSINVLPDATPYLLDETVHIPAYGVSIEPAFPDNVGDRVTFAPSSTFTWPSIFLFAFDHFQGTSSAEAFPDAGDLPPSMVRGIDFDVRSFGGVLIDPTIGGPDVTTAPVAVGVNQCDFRRSSSEDFGQGITVTRSNPNPVLYRNEIVDCTLTGMLIGIALGESAPASDLLRSNRISDGWIALHLYNPGDEEGGSPWHRVLSNAFWGNGQANFPSIWLSHTVFAYDCSMTFVNNTVAFTKHDVAAVPAMVTGVFIDNASMGVARPMVIANNIFYQPDLAAQGFADPDEITLSGSLGTGSVVLSNDFEQNGSLFTPFLLVSATNTPIASPNFVSQNDVHLTFASLGVVGAGDMQFTVPGTAATVTVGGVTLEAHSNLDFDLDARTHQPAGAPGDFPFRGADQRIGQGIRLSAPTTRPSTPQNELADAYGTVLPPAAGSNVEVWVRLTGPNGALFFLGAGTTLPMSPELQHAVVSPFGSVAIDSTSPNGATIASGTLGFGNNDVKLNFGPAIPGFDEGEVYLQALILRPPFFTTGTFTNRIRLEFNLE